MQEELDKKSTKLTVSQAAELLEIHRITVYRMIKSGRLKAIKVSPGKHLITRKAIEEYKDGL